MRGGPHNTGASPPPLPRQNVIDGDLCEAFAALPAVRQRALAGDLEKTVAEVSKMVEDMRASVGGS